MFLVSELCDDSVGFPCITENLACRQWQVKLYFIKIRPCLTKPRCRILLKFGTSHDDVIKWKHFPCNWPFVQGIHWSPVNSPHKGQWCGALMFSLICVWIKDWVNTHEAGDVRCYRALYDVIASMVVRLYCSLSGRADSRFVPSQWETSLQSNVVSHWLGAHLKSALFMMGIPIPWRIVFILKWGPVCNPSLLMDAYTCISKPSRLIMNA